MHPREPFERLLDVFDDPFKRVARSHGFAFDPRTGHAGRALRLPDDRMKRGVFLDFKNHWMQSDPADPVVVLHYGAWSSSHVLFKRFFDGKLSEFVGCVEAKLEEALSELKTLSEDIIDQDGKSFEDLERGSVEL